MKVKEALQFGDQYLSDRQLRSPREDAELLVASILECERAFLYTYPEACFSSAQERLFRDWLTKRGEHYPLQYLRGKQEFYGREFLVRPGVFIPRPETELLLEAALDILGPNSEEELLVADVGTGSGCLAVSLACEEPRAQLAAIDKSPLALQTARCNAEAHQCQSRIQFYEGDVLRPIEHRFRQYHLIVSNPPYVSALDKASVDLSVRRYEPAEAVFSGESGHEVYLELFRQAVQVLHPEGRLVVELGWGESGKVSRLAGDFGWGLKEIRKDLAGTDRCAIFELL
ncbi:MAG: peptide chain release factor N(5)-glutamine methyltransferase [Acidobacteriota bacterium]